MLKQYNFELRRIVKVAKTKTAYISEPKRQTRYVIFLPIIYIHMAYQNAQLNIILISENTRNYHLMISISISFKLPLYSLLDFSDTAYV